jgi:hypothetical protein
MILIDVEKGMVAASEVLKLWWTGVLVAMKTMLHKLFLCVRCFVAGEGLGKRRWQHMHTSFLVLLHEYRATIFRVKTTRFGCVVLDRVSCGSWFR